MLIDWFTVFAQIINFLILVWLLKKLLYKPILKMISEREEFIQKQLEDAQKAKDEGDLQRDDYEQKNREWEQSLNLKRSVLDEEMRQERQHLLQELSVEFQELRKKQAQDLKRQQDFFAQEYGSSLRREIFVTLKKVLKDLAQHDIEPLMLQVFLKKLEGMREKEKQEMLNRKKGEQVCVRTGFVLTPEMEKELKIKLKQFLGLDSYELSVSPDLIAGIELVLDGYKVSWTINDYLEDFGQRFMMTEEKV